MVAPGGTIATVPCFAESTFDTTNVSPSMSLASTGMKMPCGLAKAVVVKSTASGSSFTSATLMVTVAVSVAPRLSCAM